MFGSFINISSMRAIDFHGQAKKIELNLFITKTFLQMVSCKPGPGCSKDG